MKYKGDNLKADLDNAWEAVVKSFPRMAEDYCDANHAVHWTKDINDLDIKFLTNWCKLRDEAEYIFADAANNLHDTASALCEALKDFAKADSDAADKLNDARSEFGDKVPSMAKTTIPLSGHYYASNEYYEPKTPKFDYDSNAPTIHELMDKANTLEDKLYDLVCDEMGWPDGWVQSWVSRDSSADSADPTEKETGIKPALKKALKYNPSKLGTALGAINSVGDSGMQPFNKFSMEVDNAKDGLNPDVWDSKAATAFRHDFLNAYPDIADTHVMIVGTLAGALKGYHQALEDTHNTIDDALDAAIKACDQKLVSQDTYAKGLLTAVLSAVITIAGAVYSGGATLSFTLAGQGVSIASAALTSGGSTRKEIHSNILSTIHTAKKKLDEFDDELAKSLKEDYGNVSGNRHNPDMKVDLPRPSFVGYGAKPF
ncbi:MAG TPA: hypothetical protein VE172_19930 [Stackebrandtia sp.]|jgi:hypothetical protein|uniref:hypothetical protein n=1 Tax=Stackebrandtia sp. TaxID=2023065 RepID=UPI002D6E7583|nr:hypothetical protein [Stackebrandtia sp.]HZE41075.1 hypothetical protein [Stackebrandtia sp.]